VDAPAVMMTRVPPWFENTVARRRLHAAFVVEQSCFGPMADVTPGMPFHHFGLRLDREPLSMGWDMDGHRCGTSLPPDHVSIIPAGASAKVWWDRPVDFACLYFTPDALTDALGNEHGRLRSEVVPAIGKSSPTLSFLMRAMHADMLAGSPYGPLVGESIFVSFAAAVAGADEEGSRKSGCTPIDWRIRRAMDYVHSNFHEPMDLASIARASATSAFHLCRLFRAAMGCSLWQYVTRVRVHAARALMEREPAKTLTQIAMESGFDSYSGFIAAFKASCGIAPSRYRQQGPFKQTAWR
jgi:AraC family transcriptional regulator